jgi:hypothetical protein
MDTNGFSGQSSQSGTNGFMVLTFIVNSLTETFVIRAVPTSSYIPEYQVPNTLNYFK